MMTMEARELNIKSHDDNVACEMAFWMGKSTDPDVIAESIRETSEEIGCFSF